MEKRVNGTITHVACHYCLLRCCSCMYDKDDDPDESLQEGVAKCPGSPSVSVGLMESLKWHKQGVNRKEQNMNF